jgi:hypothetical protein
LPLIFRRSWSISTLLKWSIMQGIIECVLDNGSIIIIVGSTREQRFRAQRISVMIT